MTDAAVDAWIGATLARITAPHFCAGATLDNGVVTHCAPILAYMRGWSVQRVEDYCRTKRWRIEALGSSDAWTRYQRELTQRRQAWFRFAPAPASMRPATQRAGFVERSAPRERDEEDDE